MRVWPIGLVIALAAGGCGTGESPTKSLGQVCSSSADCLAERTCMARVPT